jgi:hemoglobin
VRQKSREITPATLGLLVRRFYARAREDVLLGPLFEAAIQDWNPHLDQITAFWTTAVLGTKTYRGNPLAAHKKHPLTPAMFDRWLALWAESLKAGLFFDPKAVGDR